MFKNIISTILLATCIAGTANAQNAQYKALNDSISKMKRPDRLKWIKDYVSKSPGSDAGPYFYDEFLKFDSETTIAQQEDMLDRFTGTAKQSPHYLSMQHALIKKKKLLPGNIAPDFSLRQANGKKLKLSSTRGKYVLIDFWASWCVPRRKAILNLKELYAKYKSEGFEIISLSADQEDSNWKKALKQEKMPWLQVCDDFPVKYAPSVVGNLYEVHFLPFYVLLDKEGKILVYSGSEKDIGQKLEQLFN